MEIKKQHTKSPDVCLFGVIRRILFLEELWSHVGRGTTFGLGFGEESCESEVDEFDF